MMKGLKNTFGLIDIQQDIQASRCVDLQIQKFRLIFYFGTLKTRIFIHRAKRKLFKILSLFLSLKWICDIKFMRKVLIAQHGNGLCIIERKVNLNLNTSLLQ